MKYLLIALLVLTGCSTQKLETPNIPTYTSPPVVPIRVDPQVQQMSRAEVVSATIQCEQDGLRAVPVMSKRIVSGMMSDIVIDIQCLPKRSILDVKF
jgi:hypothetical protein